MSHCTSPAAPIYSFPVLETQKLSIFLCLSAPWLIRVKQRSWGEEGEREEDVQLLMLQFEEYLRKGSGVILMSFVYFFPFPDQLQSGSWSTFKVSVVPGEITEVSVNYLWCHSASVLVSLLQSDRWPIGMSLSAEVGCCVQHTAVCRVSSSLAGHSDL